MNKTWEKPSIEVISSDYLENLVFNILTVESSLYASGCHQGIRKPE